MGASSARRAAVDLIGDREGQRSRGPREEGRGRPHGPATAEEEGGTEEAGVLDESKEQGSKDAGGA